MMSTSWIINAAVDYADVVVSSANPVDHIRWSFHDTSNVLPDSSVIADPNIPWFDAGQPFQVPVGTYTITVQAEDNSNTAIGTPVVTTVVIPPTNASVSGVLVRIPSKVTIGTRGN